METQNYSKGNRILWIALLIIVVVAWFKGCFDNNKPETIIKKHPAVIGSSKAVKPLNVPIVDNYTVGHNNGDIPEKHTSKANKPNENTVGHNSKFLAIIDSLKKENARMQIIFANEKDKSKLDSLYQKAIQLNSFSQSWDFPKLKATASGISRGTVESIKLDYEIKAYSDTIQIPKTRFRLLGGVETGATKDLSKMNFKANLMLQNSKGNILSAGYDSEQRIYIGYSVSIFSITR